MNPVQKIEIWGDSHHSKLFDVVRIAVGVFLILKGLIFMESTAYLKSLIENQHVIHISSKLITAIIYYITFVHLVGGIFITLGLFTRISAMMQIPVLFAVVFFTGIFQQPIYTMVWPSITALVLLFLLTIVGSGPLSLYRYLFNHEQ